MQVKAAPMRGGFYLRSERFRTQHYCLIKVIAMNATVALLLQARYMIDDNSAVFFR